MPETDDLIRRASEMEQDALATIYNTYYPTVFRYVYFRLRDQALAEDIASEVFVRMVERIKFYEQRGRPILAWLYTIARNLVIDTLHSNSRNDGSGLEEKTLKTDLPQPIQVVERNQELECLERAMGHLTEDQRLFVLLKFFESYDISEIARMMGKNERAIRSLQHRSLRSLSKALGKESCYEA